ncbi:MAG: hypothetical protein V3S55_15460 [Nitrospiraceae bacterium]
MGVIGPAYRDVSLSNPVPPGILYLKGSEFIDGSVRFIFQDDEFPQLQERAGGVWTISQLEPTFDRMIIANDGGLVLDVNGDFVLEEVA